MIIFIGAGRFGNQLFQLYFLENIRKPGEKVYSFGMNEVIKYMEGFEPLHNHEIKHFYSLFDKIVLYSLKSLAKIHIISSEIEMHNTGYSKSSKGILPITLSFGYFQTQKYIDNCPNKKIKLKEEYIIKAKNALSQYRDLTKIFIHVRHGDYDKNMQLPDEYYKQSLLKLYKTKDFNQKKTAFIFLGDDPNWCKKTFKDLPVTYYTNNDLITDFAIMILCDGAIISNSTFAWLGAYLSKNTLPIYAPKYWTNWYENKWYPLQIKTSKFEFFDWR